MKVVDVIPLTKGIGKEVLSYFSARDIKLGSLVSIPVRKKMVSGIVVSVHDAQQLKSQLKSSNYALRNIGSVLGASPMGSDFLKACIHMKNYYATTTGSVLALYTPKVVFERLEKRPHNDEPEVLAPLTDLMPDRSIFQAPFSERLSYYKTLAREQFANKKSIYICVPTQAHAEALFREISRGIEKRVVMCHTGFAIKKQNELLDNIASTEHALVIIGTPSFLFLITKQKFSTIITEFEGSEYYRNIQKPLLDARDFIYTFAYVLGISFIAADELLQVSTLYRSDQEYFTSVKSLSFKIKKDAQIHITFPTEKEFEQQVYPFLAKTSLEKINTACLGGKNVVIFTPRKGLAPLSVCQDCGTTVLDPSDNKTPLVLHEKKTSGDVTLRYYQNPRTREKFETVDACRNCGGWRIKELGISTTGMKKYLEKILPQYAESLYIIDSTETATHTKTKKLIETWQEQKGILVTTEKSLPYLIGRDVSVVVMASLESLLASPVYTAHERLARLMLGFADVAQDHAIVQVRDTTVPVLEGFKQKNLADWYQTELTDRESFKYPPFYVHIRIETIGTKDAITKREALVATLFGDVLQVKNIYQSTTAGKISYRMVVGIVLEHTSWATLPLQKHISPVYMDIFNKLQSLPEYFTIAVNPSSFSS